MKTFLIMDAIIILLFLLASCSRRWYYYGTIKEIRGDTVIGVTHSFKVYDTTGLKVGDYKTFTPTKNKKKVNSKKLN